MWAQSQRVYWHGTGDIVALRVAGDARQFGVPAVTCAASIRVSFFFRVEAIFVAEVALPAADASAVDNRYCCCNAEHLRLVRWTLIRIKTSNQQKWESHRRRLTTTTTTTTVVTCNYGDDITIIIIIISIITWWENVPKLWIVFASCGSI